MNNTNNFSICIIILSYFFITYVNAQYQLNTGLVTFSRTKTIKFDKSSIQGTNFTSSFTNNFQNEAKRFPYFFTFDFDSLQAQQITTAGIIDARYLTLSNNVGDNSTYLVYVSRNDGTITTWTYSETQFFSDTSKSTDTITYQRIDEFNETITETWMGPAVSMSASVFQSSSYLAIASSTSPSIIVSWNGSKFVANSTIPIACKRLRYFFANSQHYIAASTPDSVSIFQYNGTDWNLNPSINSTVIPTASDIRTTQLGSSLSLLAISSSTSIDFYSTTSSTLNKYTSVNASNPSSFIFFTMVHPITGISSTYMAVAESGTSSNPTPSRIWRWDETKFVLVQQVSSVGAKQWTYFKGDSPFGSDFLVLTNSEGETAHIFSFRAHLFTEVSSVKTESNAVALYLKDTLLIYGDTSSVYRLKRTQ